MDIFQYKGSLKHLRRWKKNQIWMSDPLKFNDLFDFDINISCDEIFSTPYGDLDGLSRLVRTIVENYKNINAWFYNEDLFHEIQAWANSDYPGYPENLVASIKLCLSNFGVSCFTYDGTHPLMWSHYANKHTGYVVQYKLGQMTFADLKDPPIFTKDIEYTARLTNICLSEVLLTPHKALERLVGTKSTHWAYENEIRLISPCHKNTILEAPKRLTMVAIIAGARMEDPHLAQLAKKAKQFGVPMFQAKTNNSYEITIDNKYPNK